jgi:hypothetical protein
MAGKDRAKTQKALHGAELIRKVVRENRHQKSFEIGGNLPHRRLFCP